MTAFKSKWAMADQHVWLWSIYSRASGGEPASLCYNADLAWDWFWSHTCDSADSGFRALLWRDLICLPHAGDVSIPILVEEGLCLVPKHLF